MKKLFTLISVAALALAAQANVLTVCDPGAEDGYQSAVIPVYGLWADTEGTIGQMIYPAEMLEEMVGSEISEVKFFTTAYWYQNYGDPTQAGNSAYISFANATIQLSMKVVDETGIETLIEGATAVATTVPTVGDDNMTFVLDEPFVYEGGNLLLECKVIETGSYGTTYFYGAGTEEGSNSSYYGYNSFSGWTEYPLDFLPMAAFTYEEGGDEPIDPENPYAEGYWLMIMDMNGNPVPYQLLPGDNGDYTTTVALNYNVFGPVDPQAEERPMVPFYFIVNGVRYGAEQGEQVANLGQALENPLYDANGFYTIPVGYNYNIGIAFGPQGDMYAYVAQAGYTSIDELNAKSVAGVRYYNLAGQEMQEANGLTIVVTTYTDGTTSAVKVVK